MNRLVSRGLWFTVILGGLSLAGIGAANAAGTTTSGDGGTVSGDTLGIDLNAPISLVGNSIGGLGSAADGGSAAAPASPASPAPTTSGDGGVASGDVVAGTVSVPVTVSGNSIGVLGDSTSSQAGSTPAASPAGPAPSGTTSGDGSVLGGLATPVTVSAPITISGNGVSALGDATSDNAAASTGASQPAGSSSSTTGDDSLLGGLLLPIGVDAPVTITGNALSVAGDSGSTNPTGTTTGEPAGQGVSTTSGEAGTLGGLQGAVRVDAPISVGGNAISGLGSASSTDAAGAMRTDAAAPIGATSGDNGILGRTLLPLALAVPVSAGGSAVSVIGDSTSTDAAVTAGAATAPVAGTSGERRLLEGVLAPMRVSLPVRVGGDAVGLIGESATTGAVTALAGGPGSSGSDGTPGTAGILRVTNAAGGVVPASSVTPVEASGTGPLADTGSNLIGTIGAAGLALLAGAGTLVVARRRFVRA